MAPDAPDVDLDQEKDDVDKSTTDTLTISQEISERTSIDLGISKDDQGGKEVDLGITIRF